MARGEAQCLDQVFKSHTEIIYAILSDIKENPSTCTAETESLNFFWIKICLVVQGISKDATNLCMAFSKPPVPSTDEADAILKKLEGDTVALIATFYSLSLSTGLTLKKRIHGAVFDIVRAVLNLVKSIQGNEQQSRQDQRQKTGNVWDCCDQISNLPRDNSQAVLSKVKESQGLVNDALQEVEEAQTEEDGQWDDFEAEDFSNPTWSDADKELLGPALGLVKATKACLKKTSALIKNVSSSELSPDAITALDGISEHMEKISPNVDDLVSSLYPPMQYHVVKENAQSLSHGMKSILDFLRACCLTQNTDESWINFLTQATDHNFEKLLSKVVNGH